MTDKQRKFLAVYLKTGNAKMAARAAGYMAVDDAKAILRQKAIREALAALSKPEGAA